MSRIDPHPADQSPAGLLADTHRLKPWSSLQRLRPLQLAAFTHQLKEHARLGLAFTCVKRYFPERLEEYPEIVQVGWWQVLAHLANQVEAADWFEINWGLLNEAWATWMNDESEGGDHLAAFLHYIPITLYGFGHQGELFNYPPMELLHVLLSHCDMGVVSNELLINSEIYDSLDDWSRADRQAAWARLHEIEADPGRHPEPVRWLPELARWACHSTHNLILDRDFDPYNPERGPWFRWTDQTILERLKTDWKKAKRTIAKLDPLMAWHDVDSSNLVKLAEFLMEENHDPFTW